MLTSELGWAASKGTENTLLLEKKKSTFNSHITAGIGAGLREMSDQRTQPEINKSYTSLSSSVKQQLKACLNENNF